MSKNLELRLIYELLHNEERKYEIFFIQSYQRGILPPIIQKGYIHKW